MTHCPQYKTYKIWLIKLSGGSSGGARAHALFWVKKEEMTEGRKAGWASKIKRGPLISSKSGSTALDRSSEIPALNGFVNTIHWDQNQSDLSDLTLKSVNHRRPVLDLARGCDSWCWPEEAQPLGRTVVWAQNKIVHGFWTFQHNSCTSLYFTLLKFIELHKNSDSLLTLPRSSKAWNTLVCCWSD